MARLALSLLLLLSLAACDSGEPDAPNPLPVFGAFSTTVTSSAGDSTTFSGNAFARFGGDRLESITLYEAGAEGLFTGQSVALSPRMPFPPEPETYVIGGLFEGDTPFTALYSDLRTLGGRGFFAEAGTLTLDAVTEEEVHGHFAFEGTGRSSDPDSFSARYAVRGTFEALVTRPPGDGFTPLFP